MTLLEKRPSVALAAVCAFTFASVAVGVYGAYGDTSSPAAVLTPTVPGRMCAGDPATLAWTPPAEVSDVNGYEIEHLSFDPSPSSVKTAVGLDTTALAVTLRFGFNSFLIRSITSTGADPTPFTSTSALGPRPPQAVAWDFTGRNSVAEASATVSFRWNEPITTFTYGGSSPTTVRLTASPGGHTVDIAFSPASQSGVTAHFAGLTNGVGYTFRAVTFNACGESAAQSSPVFTPGLAPEWTRSSPPLSASPGQYVYKFAAVGDPAPAFTLLDAPDWLAISAKGLLSGRPPEGTHSFSYSVVAANGVGIGGVVSTDLWLGPFTVEVRTG